MVFVVNMHGKPLMPCESVIARLLLKQGKAKCIRSIPFTIKLTYKTTNYTQPITLGIDTGSSKIGSAAVKDNGEVVYVSEVTVRNDVTEKMKRRSIYRKNRRNRKTRYRKARFMNRKNSKREDRISPTVKSKIDSHLKEIKFVQSILPISKIILETASFDTTALSNPEVLKSKILYQRGASYGFANMKAYILNRDGYTCQYCKRNPCYKTDDKHLHVHHIIFRSNGGSDHRDNLITLCKTHHDELHANKITIKGGKEKGNTKHATHMNSIRVQLLKALPCAIETFGFVTKENRQLLKLPKEHYIDAVVIASQGNCVTFSSKNLIIKKCIADGDYQQSKGVRSEKKIPTGKISGFRKFDKVKYLGKEYFIKGRQSKGYAVLMDCNWEEVKLEPMAKFCNMQRIQARKSWMMTKKIAQTTCQENQECQQN